MRLLNIKKYLRIKCEYSKDGNLILKISNKDNIMTCILDIHYSTIAIVLLLPFMIPIIIGLKLTGEHCIFYTQERVGRYGKYFRILKFATIEIIRLIGEATSHKCRILNVNKKSIANVAILGNVLHLPLNQERLKKLTENYIVSNEKIKKALGINYLPLSAKEGLIKTIQSFESESVQG